MKQTRGRGIDNPVGYSQMMGSPYKTRECPYTEPLYRHSSKPTAKIVVGKSTAPLGSYTWEAT